LGKLKEAVKSHRLCYANHR